MRPPVHVVRPLAIVQAFAARAAVRRGVERRLAAVGRVAVAVAEARVARRDRARPGRARGGRVGQAARRAARAAVGRAVLRCVSQPLPGCPSQSRTRPQHVGTHSARPCTSSCRWQLLHALPHAPQFVVVLSGVSQPLATLLSQLPKPASHTRSSMRPGCTRGVPLVLLHALPQAPQLRGARLRVRLAAVGGVAVAVAEARGAGEMAHVPVAQDVWRSERLQGTPHPPQFVERVEVRLAAVAGVAVAVAEARRAAGDAADAVHASGRSAGARSTAWPQVPQLLMSVVVFVSQPLTGLPSQLPKPVVQAGDARAGGARRSCRWRSRRWCRRRRSWSALVCVLRLAAVRGVAVAVAEARARRSAMQAPAVHAVVPFAFVQAVPQAPQFDVLVWRVRLAAVGGVAVAVANPAERSRHAGARAAGRSCRSCSCTPCRRRRSSLVGGDGGLAAVGGVAVAVGEAGVARGERARAGRARRRGVGQIAERAAAAAVRQVVVRLVSQPLLALPSQSAKPALHEPRAHDPAAHDGVALASAQPWPQAPQLVSVVSSDVSQPLAAVPSQSAKPALHAPSWHAPPGSSPWRWRSCTPCAQRRSC